VLSKSDNTKMTIFYTVGQGPYTRQPCVNRDKHIRKPDDAKRS